MRAVLPRLIVIGVNLIISFLILPLLDLSFLAEERWGGTSPGTVGGVLSVATALAAAIVAVIIINP
jgi:hypothetical protein